MMNWKSIFYIELSFVSLGCLLMFAFLFIPPQQALIMAVSFAFLSLGAYFRNIVRFAERINLKIKTRKNQQLRGLNNLYSQYSDLQGQLDEVKRQIAKYPADPETFVFLSNYIKNMREEPEKMKGKGMSEIFYDIITRLNRLESLPHNKPTTQNSTPEEKHPQNQRNLKKNCSYCQAYRFMFLRIEFADHDEYFCTRDCRDKYCLQFDKGIKM